MGKLNVANRTLAIMDNLAFLRRLNNECIDLIAIAPPFAANETFTGNPRPPISDAEYAEEIALARAHGAEHNEGQGETRVHDIWSWDEDVHPAWKMRIEDTYPSVHAVIQAVEACASENEAAYIAFMAARLLECRRVLKPTGSIYLHCDSHANSYLRMLMDAVFGARNFRNEITWRRTHAAKAGSRNPLQSAYGAVTDTILFYTKDPASKVRIPKVFPDGFENEFKYQDEVGRYRTHRLVASAGMHQSPTYEWRGLNPEYGWLYNRAGMDKLEREGRIHYTRNGTPYRKEYDNEYMGRPVSDLWVDVSIATGHERTGYATQKPLELYERIINASSNPGDVVLDIFAGCATTAIAAETLGRQWVACDMAYRAWTMLKRRFYLNGIAMADMTDATKNALASVKKSRGFQEPQQWTTSHTIGPNELPKRDDVDPAPHHDLNSPRRGARQTTQSSGWSGRIPKDDAKQLLIQQFGPVCWGCGYEPRRPNGSLDETLLEVDHIRARKAAQGTQGNDELYNLALLHRTCNSIKRNQLTLEELRSHNAMNGLLYVDKVSDLVDLYEATQFAAEQIVIHTARRGLQSELSQ